MSRRPSRWATATVRLAAGFIEPGPVRVRYEQELASELWGTSRRRQAGHALSALLAAPALHRALWESGQVSYPHSVWWCRAHLRHRWHVASADDGTRYQRCRACGVDNDGTMRAHPNGGYGIAIHGVVPG